MVERDCSAQDTGYAHAGLSYAHDSCSISPDKLMERRSESMHRPQVLTLVKDRFVLVEGSPSAVLAGGSWELSI